MHDLRGEVKETIIGAKTKLDLLNKKSIIRKVNKSGKTSGLIYVPKSYVGQKVEVNFEDSTLIKEVKKSGKSCGVVYVPKTHVKKSAEIKLVK